jgi:hypothetical protein
MIKFKVIKPKKNAIVKDAMEALKEQISDKLKRVQCPDHYQHPKVIISGSISNPKFEIKGCCQKLIDEATKILT